MQEKSRALQRAREAVRRAESAPAEHRAGDVSDPYRLADLLTARDLAKAVCAVVEEDDRVARHSR